MLRAIKPTQTLAWKKLEEHYQALKGARIQKLMIADPDRGNHLSICFEDQLFFDFCKQPVNTETLELLFAFAKEMQLEEGVEKMFMGEKINATEDRSVLHIALRNRTNTPIYYDGIDVMPAVNGELEKLKLFTDNVHSSEHLGYTGKPLRYIVNIGIGGSNLGPLLVVDALREYRKENIQPFFVSNIDGSALSQVLNQVEPEETLFIIASKSFTTQETMTNARSARAWLIDKGCPENQIGKHFVALSTNLEAVVNFGIHPENMFAFWDWVGGRFSLSSAIGLSIMLSIGSRHFFEFLDGMHAMDQHFHLAPLEKNLPILGGLISIWNTNFCNAETEAVLPYDEKLTYLPAYLQQGFMESNGKSIDRNGDRVDYSTGSILWGEKGTDGQHAFFQLIHQGTRYIPCEFVVAAQSNHPFPDHHNILLANCFAQSEALLNGKSSEVVEQELLDKGMDKNEVLRLTPYKTFAGNKPSTTILLEKISPATLGMLLAYYEHKIFVKGYLLNIYSFDQWGVELGKVLAKGILAELNEGKVRDHDASTTQLLEQALKWTNA